MPPRNLQSRSWIAAFVAVALLCCFELPTAGETAHVRDALAFKAADAGDHPVLIARNGSTNVSPLVLVLKERTTPVPPSLRIPTAGAHVVARAIQPGANPLPLLHAPRCMATVELRI